MSTEKVPAVPAVPRSKAHPMNVDAFIKEFADHTEQMENKRFCFLLGAGASKPSGISLGSELALEWLKEIHVQEAPPDQVFEVWATTENLGIEGFDLKNAASFYTRIFERRFDGQMDTGQFWLEQKFGKAIPSPGYYFLAQVLHGSPHKVVVTTNFDNLAADTVLQLSGNLPRIISDARIARYLSPQPRLPIIAKIHGDIGFATTKNTTDGVAKLDEEWKEPLRRILSLYTPIIIGWEGNDGSLMDFLTAEMVDKDGLSLLPAGIYWCYRPDKSWQARIGANPKLDALARVHAVRFIAIDGFDEFLLKLAESLSLPSALEKLKEQQEKRRKVFGAGLREEATRLEKTEAVDPKSRKPQKKASVHLRAMVAVSDAIEEKTDAKRLEKLREAAKTYPENARPHAALAEELHSQEQNDDEAEEHFRQAIWLNPKDASTLSNYARFLKDRRKDDELAEEYYQRAVSADPSDAFILCTYATFLAEQRKDAARAEEYFQKALAADPSDAFTLGNYAMFLADYGKDDAVTDEYFRKATVAEPSDAFILFSYAEFLATHRNDDERANDYYQKAAAVAPSDGYILSTYANFLVDRLKDAERAEEYFQKAVAADPSDVFILVSYANFLAYQRKDDDQAEEYFQKALAADPNDTDTFSDYAKFLTIRRKDDDHAEEYFQKTLAADPTNAETFGNYGEFLVLRRTPAKAREHFRNAAQTPSLRDAANGDYAAAILWMTGALRAGTGEPTAAIVGALKAIVTVSDYASGWSYDLLIAWAQQHLTNLEEAAFWIALARVCACVEKPATLDGFPQWRDAEPVLLEAGLRAATDEEA